ncbi:Glycosyltransferase involved in cell wall bisynthesis [Tenacibaculum sp. MAR_2009_124]|uniref:glycosyltransferase family 4 protein n=1 Tax=Tenacibaculum sp. MAR_2009_124 TaxID=1250059 RepID=UPI000898C464|nr:glycosyltransferase family 4 protein [Tenacibaculum sp. MAR_2009_124]SEC89911.1 Glycosyltransferase involved in cell wall bisynthesis [Tenacibaculum sp. MAR_2009_124]
MRVGMILDNVYPPDPRVENEALELIKDGHEVFLFCLTYGQEVNEELVKGIHVRRYKTNMFEYKMSALVYTIPIYTFLMKKKIKDFIVKNKVDIVHIHDMKIAQAAFEANYNDLPTILDLHENRPEIMRFYPHMKKLRGKLLISIEKWIKKEEEFVRKATNVVVVTEEAKKELASRAKISLEKLVVVPNTVRTAFFEDTKHPSIPFKKSEDEFVLLYLGDTGERRGLDTVFESMVKLKNEIQNLIFVVVGKSSQRLENKVSELGLENQVKIMGWQNDATFPEWIKNSDVCLSPLHRNIHHDTTYANKIFQYMSLGKPLLVSDATAQEEVVMRVNSGLAHQAKNIDDFTEKLLRLYKNEGLRTELGKNGSEFVRNTFTWDKTSKDLKELYKKLA